MTTQTKAFASTVAFPIIVGLLLFGIAGDLAWGMGWLFVALYMALTIMMAGLFLHKQPGLAEERRSGYKKATGWDKILLPAIVLVVPLLILIVSGLDHRFKWTTSLTLFHQLLFFSLSALGILITYWAMLTNRFFSSAVRIQTDRGHVVVTTGPYRFVRHPGYVGAILYNLSMPVALGSLWGLIPGVVEMGLFIVRTRLEDHTLQNELDGYRDYAEKVPYRLIPFIW